MKTLFPKKTKVLICAYIGINSVLERKKFRIADKTDRSWTIVYPAGSGDAYGHLPRSIWYVLDIRKCPYTKKRFEFLVDLFLVMERDRWFDKKDSEVLI